MKKLICAVIVLAVSTARASTIHVDVVVAPGTYFETLDTLGNAITLRSSDGPQVTIIDATGFFHVVQCVTDRDPSSPTGPGSR